MWRRKNHCDAKGLGAEARCTAAMCKGDVRWPVSLHMSQGLAVGVRRSLTSVLKIQHLAILKLQHLGKGARESKQDPTILAAPN